MKRFLPRFSLATLLLIVTLSALAFGSYYVWQSASRRAELTAIFGGEQGIAILSNPDKVEAYRLDKRSSPRLAAKLTEYPIKSGPVSVSKTDQAKLQSALSDRSAYYWGGMAKACIPTPGVRFDFIRGNEKLHVLLCFECDLLESWQNDRLVGGKDFDPGRTKLLQIVKSIFPNDPVIQALKP